MIRQVLMGMFLLSSCSLLPTEEERAINYNVHERKMAEETERLESAFLGKTKDEVLKVCGEPKEKEQNVTYQNVGYEERWNYERRCAPLVYRAFDLYYRSQSFYFLNDQVAEIFVSIL